LPRRRRQSILDRRLHYPALSASTGCVSRESPTR
jgi:hypothetical protein